MPLVLVAGVGLSVLLLAFTMQGMQGGSPYWLKALLNAFAHPHGSFLKRTALKALAPLAHGVAWIYHETMHAFSVAASHSIHSATRWVEGLAAWVTHLAVTVGDLAADTEHAVVRLVHHELPRQIHKATAVIGHEAHLGLREAEQVAHRLRVYARGIDRLLNEKIRPAIRALRHTIEVTLPRELGRIRARARSIENEIRHPSRTWLKRMARTMWAVALFGLVIRTLARRFPWLFCRKTASVGRRVCGLDSDLLGALLLDTLILSGSISVVQMAKELQAIEGAALAIIRDGIDEL